MNKSIVGFEAEKYPILEKKETSVEESLSEFEKILDADVPEWQTAFYYGLGEIISSEIYDYTDYTKYWTNEGEISDKKFAAEAVQKAFYVNQELVTSQIVENYFTSPELGSDQQTLAMLKELEKMKDEQAKWRICKAIIAIRLDQMAGLDESKKEFARFISMYMRNLEFRLGSIREGKDAKQAVFNFLATKSSFDFEQYVPIWKDRIKHQILPARTIGLDIERVLELENARPGIAETLIKDFDLKNLGRYPAEVLLEQVDQEGNLEIPYGVFVSSESDWNNSLHMGVATVADFFHSLKKQGTTLRLAEFDGNIDLIRKLQGFQKRYGQRQLINFGVLNAHGNKDGIRMGGGNRDGDSRNFTFDQRTAGEREKMALQNLRTFFSDDATLILASCSVGQEEGVAQAISKTMKIRVIGPVNNSFTSSIIVSRGDINLDFKVEYRDGDGKRVETNVFKNGEVEK